MAGPTQQVLGATDVAALVGHALGVDVVGAPDEELARLGV
jgi:hypothetical protein